MKESQDVPATRSCFFIPTVKEVHVSTQEDDESRLSEIVRLLVRSNLIPGVELSLSQEQRNFLLLILPRYVSTSVGRWKLRTLVIGALDAVPKAMPLSQDAIERIGRRGMRGMGTDELIRFIQQPDQHEQLADTLLRLPPRDLHESWTEARTPS